MSRCHLPNCSAYTARYQYVKVNSANPNEIRAQLLQTVTSPGLGDDDGTNNDVQSAHEAAVGDQNVAVDDDVDAQQKSALITAHEQRRLTAMEAIFMQGDWLADRACMVVYHLRQHGLCVVLRCVNARRRTKYS